MKSERPDLPLTIARLVRSATAVAPLEGPTARLARWAAIATAFVLSSVVILGVRPDVAAQMVNPWFVARVAASLGVAVSAAIAGFLTSVPGSGTSPLVRVLPVAACLAWAALLAGAMPPSPLDLLRHAPPHPSCVVLIAVTALPPLAVLVRMLRRAAPLEARWTGALAGLASLAAGALGVQFVCTSDAAAHHLIWHFTPVVLLTLPIAVVGSSLFDVHRETTWPS